MLSARAVLVVWTLVAAPWPAASQPASPTPTAAQLAARPANAAAMYEFLLARRAEAADDLAAAEAALQRAVTLDPTSAELRAEQAGFFARQNRAADAVAAAERAIGLDASSEEGHRILGLVYAAWADGAVAGPKGGTTGEWRDKAIGHLTRIQASPTMVSDLGLQMTLARQLLASGDAARAVPLLERVAGQTASAEPLALLAEAHRSLGQFERAAAVLEQAAGANPRYYLALGDLYERQNKWEEAAAAYEKGAATVRGPGRELRLRRAQALLNIDGGAGVDRAVTLLTEFVAANPKDLTGHTLLARAHLQRGANAEAERAAKAALALEPANLQVLGLLAGVYRERHDYAAITALLGPATRDAAQPSGPRLGEFVRLLAELGGAQQQLGESSAAVDTFERARALLPSSLPVAAALAQAHLQARQFDQAQRVARDARVASSGPADLGLLRIEALAGIKAGRAADAVAFLERSVGDRRTSQAGAFVLADVYEEARRFDDAIKAITSLGGAAPADDAVAFRLAAAYEAADRVSDAERVFRAILARDPLHANALNYLGYMLADRGQRLDEALALVDRALAAEPGNPAFLDSRGWALFKLGRPADAEEPLRRAATALRGSSVIQSHYADVLAALDKPAEAAAALDLALGGDGVDVDRAALERRLRQLRQRPR
ncbi:MAG: tetratricopeptide repeat protein [Vicinamibacterales bacterium]